MPMPLTASTKPFAPLWPLTFPLVSMLIAEPSLAELFVPPSPSLLDFRNWASTRIRGLITRGKSTIVDIGIPPAYVDAVVSRTSLDDERAVQTYLPSDAPSSHKGTFGHAGIIAGSVGKTGAAALAARAALRVGAGLVTVAIPSSVNDVLEAKLVEAMTAPMPETKARTLARTALDRLVSFMAARTAIAIGPGLSTAPETVELIQALTKQLDRPAVFDADALNALTGRTALLASCKTPPIITPHPGEMARLEPDATSQTVNNDRHRYCYPLCAGAWPVRCLEREPERCGSTRRCGCHLSDRKSWNGDSRNR